MTIGELLEKLAAPIPYKWRVQSYSKNKPQATCVAYIDSRDVQNRLDEVCGVHWQSDYKEIGGSLFGGIAIRVEDEWAWRWDCGTESIAEKAKGEASDAFKRSAVKWGVGRFLYDLKIQYVPANEKKTGSNYPHCVDNQGKKIWDLTEHINGKRPPMKMKKLPIQEAVICPPSEEPVLQPLDDFISKEQQRLLWTLVEEEIPDKHIATKWLREAYKNEKVDVVSTKDLTKRKMDTVLKLLTEYKPPAPPKEDKPAPAYATHGQVYALHKRANKMGGAMKSVAVDLRKIIDSGSYLDIVSYKDFLKMLEATERSR